jgi:hypothetical protein
MVLLDADGGVILFFLFLGIVALVLAVYLLRVILGTHKIVDIYDKLEKLDNEMICPCCLGKGFVDKNDIIRLDKLNSWKQGYCKYCDARGKVEKEKTKKVNPIDSY